MAELKEPPFKIKLTIVLLGMIENCVITLVYPILPFMVNHYLSDGTSEFLISQYSGYLEGTYRLTQFLACIWIGMLSDRVGRKKILIFTTFCHVLASSSLAFCTSFRQALFNRFLGGLCAGSTPITKSLIRELSTDKNISKLYGVFALGVGLANLVGPLYSMTANPAKSIPEVFNNAFFVEYPYSLPLLLHGLTSLFTLLIIIFCLDEPVLISEEKKEPVSSLITNRMYLTTVLVYWFMGIFQFGFRLTFSLICRSSQEVGGMGIGFEYQVSLVQLIGGIITTFLPAFLIPKLSVKFGLLNSLKLVGIGLGLLAVVVSFSNSLPGVWKYASLCTFYGIENSLTSIFIMYISICISNTVGHGILATAIGVSQALIGIGRFFSTFSMGNIYGWSVDKGLALPLIDAKLSFYVIALAPLIDVLILKIFVNESVEKKKAANPSEISLIDKRS